MPADTPTAHGAVEPLDGVDEWAEHALSELSLVADVSRAGIAVVEGGGRRLLFTASDRVRGATHDWCHVDALAAAPLNDAIASGTAVNSPLAGLDARHAAFVAAQRGTGYVDISAVPFATTGPAVGGFVLYYSVPQAFDATQQSQLRGLASSLEQRLRSALERPGSPLPSVRRPPEGLLVAEHDVRAHPAAVGEARRFLRETLTEWSIGEETADHAVLCLSELATNALIHTGSGCRVQVELHERVLTTRVHDIGSALVPRVAATDDTLPAHGHGLRLLDALVSRWGQTNDSHSAAVWFDLELPD